jgi:hypothetical protein
MKLGIRNWIAAVLLLALGFFGSPETRVAIPRFQTAVWTDRSERTQREISEPREALLKEPGRMPPTTPSYRSVTPPDALDRSLFQRPPPSALRS